MQGEGDIACYTFNTHKAKHTFCRVCGVQSFYTPRSNPDGYGIAVHCLDPGTAEEVKIIQIDGQNWEQAVNSDPTIKSRSIPN